MITIDIANRVLAAFGYVPKMSTVRGAMAVDYAKAIGSAALSGIHSAYLRGTNAADVYVADSPFANLTLRNTETGELFVFDGGGLNNAYGEILAPPPMLKFTRSKQIVTTTVDGSDSEVVESFGLKPYSITLSGILVDMENHHYPSSKVQQLRELFEANTIFDVLDCKLMDDLGIESLYFTKLENIEVVLEYQDTVKFELKANSVKPLEFFI